MLVYPQQINAIGLIISMIGSVVLVWPYIVQSHRVDDEFIELMDMKTGKYLQRKHIKERRVNLIGFLLLGTGFLFQFVCIILGK